MFGPKTAIFARKYSLLVGWLVVVARGLYLARHLSTFFIRVLDKDSFGSKVLERYVVCITSENKG